MSSGGPSWPGLEVEPWARFPLTPWSLVVRAGDAEAEAEARAALGILLQRYLPALRAHLVLHRRIPHDLADDLLQGFVSQKVLEQRLFARSDRSRGRFRTFLLTALDHFVVDELRKQRARGGRDGYVTALLDWEPSGESPASDAFDRAWAREVIDEAVRRMRAECEDGRRPDLWGVFEQRLLAPALRGAEPAPYQRLVEQFELCSPTQASNVLMTGKRMFARTLRGVLRESAQDEQEVDEDLRDLRRAAAQAAPTHYLP